MAVEYRCFRRVEVSPFFIHFIGKATMTYYPIIAGIVEMDKKKFVFNNIIGSLAWVFLMLFAGHYLEEFILVKFNFDLKKHLEVIVIGIVVITTAPVLYKLFFGRKGHPAPADDPYAKDGQDAHKNQ